MAWSQLQREKYEKLLQSKPVNSSSAPVVTGTSIGNQQGLVRDEHFPQGPPRYPNGKVDREDYTTVKTREGDVIKVPVIDNKNPQPGPITRTNKPNERLSVEDMMKILDKAAENQKGVISDLLKQQYGYGSAKKLRDTIIDAPLIEAQLMSMQADREVENLKAVPRLGVYENPRPDNFNYTQLIHGGSK